jgi:hypothetical protein
MPSKRVFETAYVLVDSWFMCDTFVSEIHKIKIRYTKKLHVIGFMKTNRLIMIKGKDKMENFFRIISEKTSDFAKTQM